MKRQAVLFQARPGLSDEYVRRHSPIWNELEQTLKAFGACNYSIFLHEDTGLLFGYVEIEDEERFQEIAETDVCQRWWRYMTEVLVCEGGKQKGKEWPLREVFHLD